VTVIKVRTAKVVVTTLDLTVKIARQLDLVYAGSSKAGRMSFFYLGMLIAADRVLGRINLKTLGRDYPDSLALVVQDEDEVVLVSGLKLDTVTQYPLLVLAS